MNKKLNIKRAKRIRKKLKRINTGRFRLTIFRSSANISAQIIDNKNTLFFTSISNINFRAKNVFYEHHFGNRKPEFDKYDLSGVFSFMDGSLASMIGLALYMGFKKAVLVGVDYSFSPSILGHFIRNGSTIEMEERYFPTIHFSYLEQYYKNLSCQ